MSFRSSPFTQGGQTQLHKLRMLKQVSLSTFRLGCCGGFLGWMTYMLVHYTFRQLLMFPACGLALFIYELQRVVPSVNCFCFFVIDETFYRCSATWFLSNSYCMGMVQSLSVEAKNGLWWGLLSFIFMSVLVVFYFLKKGAALHQTQKLSGGERTTLKGYKRFLKKEKIPCALTIDDMPLPKEAELKHMMITGTTGSGKTNFIIHLLKALRERGDKVILVDTTGGYVSRFYDEKMDVLLNPLDERSVQWDLFNETTTPHETLEMSSFLIPKPSHQSEFWTNAARLMLSEGIQILKRNDDIPSFSKLRSLLLKEDIQSVSSYFKDSSIASFFSGKSQETVTSIRMTLATAIHFLECLEEVGDFCVRNWVKQKEDSKAENNKLENNKKGWLFLACDPEQRTYMQGLLTCWVSLAVKALMGCGEEENKRVWFIIDELASLNVLPSLETALAELRKYGGCVVLGFQNMAQLEALYGHSITASLSELTGTKVIFSCVDPKVATRMSEMLGQQEVLEASENISFGANEIRDGVSLAHHKKLKSIVKQAELMQLKPLECFIKTSLGAPVFETKFSYLALKKVMEGFKAKPSSRETKGSVEKDEKFSDIKEELNEIISLSLFQESEKQMVKMEL